MRFVLLGAVASTVVALRQLVRSGEAPVLLITLERDRSSRHSDHVELADVAAELGVTPVISVPNARTVEVARRIQEAQADLLLVVGWSEILPPQILGAARHGTLGYHPSPLPELRGRGVIPWTVLLARESTGGTLFWMGEGVDDGDIAYQRRFALDLRDTATSLYAKHMEVLADMVRELAKTGSPADIPRTPQVGEASYCAQRKPVDGLIDWGLAANDVDRLIRASARPYPGGRAFLAKGGSEVVIWSSSLPRSETYHGVPGQVVALQDGKPLITCGRGLVRLNEVTDVDGTSVNLRVQDRFVPLSLALHRWADTHGT